MPTRYAAAALVAASAALPVRAATDLPLAPTYYVENMIGRYAAPGRCGSEDIADYLVISELAVQIGDVLCEGVGKQTWEEGRMLVPLYTCKVQDEDVQDRTLSLERLTGGDLSVQTSLEEGRVPNEVLQRCGP